MQIATYESVRTAAGREGADVREFCPARAPVSLSVIIPAHNEAALLPRCLHSLLSQRTFEIMRVIVVDNGSHDGTADVAGRWAARFEARGHELVILRLSLGNKSAALNAGDAAAALGKCRVYLDADVELSPGCISEVSAAMTDGSGVQMCAPRMRVAISPGWVTRRYARVWTSLPWVRDDAIGGGFYAVSAAGRERWNRFPDVLAEDVFVQAQFKLTERRVIHSEHFLIHLPDSWADLLRLRTRWLSGNRQIARQVKGEWGRAAYPLSRRLRMLLTHPALWPDLPLYFTLNAAAFWRARRREALGTKIWERCRPQPQIDSMGHPDFEPMPE